MNAAAFRELVLALPGATEGEHHGHPDFRAHGRVFASLHPDGERAMVHVPVPLQQRLVATDAGAYAAAAGAWGRAGCTMVRLAAAGLDEVRDALAEAWQLAAVRAAGTRGSKRSGDDAGKRQRAPAKRPAAPAAKRVAKRVPKRSRRK